MVLYNPDNGQGVQDINQKEKGFMSEKELKKRINYSESQVSMNFGQKKLDRIHREKQREAEKKQKKKPKRLNE